MNPYAPAVMVRGRSWIEVPLVVSRICICTKPVVVAL
jgi:hypothetical protein